MSYGEKHLSSNAFFYVVIFSKNILFIKIKNDENK